MGTCDNAINELKLAGGSVFWQKVLKTGYSDVGRDILTNSLLCNIFMEKRKALKHVSKLVLMWVLKLLAW